MTDLTKNSEDMSKKPSRRNLLRNAAVAATGAVMLFLSGCTKEGPLHRGGLLGASANTWYTLKATYRTSKGAPVVGYFAPIGRDWTTPYYSEMRIDNGTGMKFKRHPAEKGDGWEYLETEDGLWLDLSYAGWVYRSDDKEIAWKIVDGKLYHSYSRWIDYPIGSQERGGLVSNPFNVQAYYTGVALGDQNVLTNCEFVPVQ